MVKSPLEIPASKCLLVVVNVVVVCSVVLFLFFFLFWDLNLTTPPFPRVFCPSLVVIISCPWNFSSSLDHFLRGFFLSFLLYFFHFPTKSFVLSLILFFFFFFFSLQTQKQILLLSCVLKHTPPTHQTPIQSLSSLLLLPLSKIFHLAVKHTGEEEEEEGDRMEIDGEMVDLVVLSSIQECFQVCVGGCGKLFLGFHFSYYLFFDLIFFLECFQRWLEASSNF